MFKTEGVDVFPDKNISTKDTSEVDSSRPNEFAVTKGIAEGNEYIIVSRRDDLI